MQQNRKLRDRSMCVYIYGNLIYKEAPQCVKGKLFLSSVVLKFLPCIRISWSICEERLMGPRAEFLIQQSEVVLRSCISNKLPSDASIEVAGPKTIL